MSVNPFTAGGTLRPDAPTYVQRPADEQLYQAASNGRYSYVLTARQMGKSSLMVRTARRLQAEDVKTAVIDLTALGTNLTDDEWYLGLLIRLQNQLRLSSNVRQWWQEQSDLGVVQRFTTFLRQILINHIEQPVVIFIDEIDSTLNLPFSDDFFAAIRALYNERATDPLYNRLTFIFLGVAVPADLIKDSHRTPFNIGQAIELQTFTKEDASNLEQLLQQTFGEGATAVFQQIYHWTNGHPYLTQRLCATAVETDSTDIDALVNDLFLTDEAQGESNLQFVSTKLLAHPRKNELLKLYRHILRGDHIPDDKQSLLHSQLKLTGLVQARYNELQVHNPIYARVFDQPWVREHTAVPLAPFITITAILITLFAIGTLLYDNAILSRQAQNNTEAFRQAETSPTRTVALANLLALNPIWANNDIYTNIALDLFYSLPDRAAQEALFTDTTFTTAEDLTQLIHPIYITLADTDGSQQSTPLLQTMAQSLNQFPDDVLATKLHNEIEQWLAARTLIQGDAFNRALEQYTAALTVNGRNPALLYERARLHAYLGSTQSAAQDLENILALAAENAPLPTATITPQPTIGPLPTSSFRNLINPPNHTPLNTTSSPTPPLSATSTSTLQQQSEPIFNSEANQAFLSTTALPQNFTTRNQHINAIRNLIAIYPILGDILAASPTNQYPNLHLTGLIPTLTSQHLYLTFDDGDNPFMDKSGYTHHGQCAVCPPLVSGVRGTAVQFDGTSQSISLHNPDSLQIIGPITLVAWINATATDGFRNIIAHGFTRDPVDKEIVLRINDGVYQVGSWDGSDHHTSYEIPEGDNGRWVHLVGVYDGTFWRLYHDGLEVSATADTIGAIVVNENWAIGARGTGDGRFFAGAIDEVHIYNRALSASEIWELFISRE
jgi:hypothetical protein